MNFCSVATTFPMVLEGASCLRRSHPAAIHPQHHRGESVCPIFSILIHLKVPSNRIKRKVSETRKHSVHILPRSTMLVTILLSLPWLCLSSAIVSTRTFTPNAIRLTVGDLPSPYHTSSARKPSIVIAIPQNATLFVPDPNFRVTVFRERMASPRNMIYTPSGDILVTEMRGNQIVILTGDNTSVFANETHGISRAFGMAFTQVTSLCIRPFFHSFA